MSNPIPIEIALTQGEARRGALCGVERQIAALVAKLKDRHGAAANDPWTLHIEGACGEVAFAKAYGLVWVPTVNTFKRPDVGGYQVRTRSEHSYDLLVRTNDADDEPFALVTGKVPYFRVWGVILGAEAKRPEWVACHGGREAAWFVPKEMLRHPWATLPSADHAWLAEYVANDSCHDQVASGTVVPFKRQGR